MSKFKPSVFRGSATALVTPFKEGKLDLDALKNNIEFQISSGTDALVVCGTTGESATLSEDEHKVCIEFAIKTCAGRIPVIAGTGSNCTEKAIKMSRFASDAGADALLVVTPYYNKATPKGLIKSFRAIADASSAPIILYNVPSRTGVNLSLSVLRELSFHEHIVAIKDAAGDIGETSRIIAELGDRLDVYAGNDNMTVPTLALGGAGVISVASNIVPCEMHRICSLFFEGKTDECAALSASLAELFHALFVEVNPIPVKTAMAKMGLCAEEFRLPLCECEEKNRALIYSALQKLNLI